MSLDFFLIPLSIVMIFVFLSLGAKNELKRTKLKKKYIRQ